jgi:hypothetical protein
VSAAQRAIVSLSPKTTGVPIAVLGFKAEKRSFLIEILRIEAGRSKALTICGRGRMTLSGRRLLKWQFLLHEVV